jgi:O-antigen/teichoic acid export membrane protein
MKLPNFVRQNLLLKITSLNSGVIVVRLLVSFFIQRELADIVGKSGYAKIGSLRNLLQMLTSLTSLGVFNGIVKYVAEDKDQPDRLQQLFSTTFVFTIIGSLGCIGILFFGAPYISDYFFYTESYSYIVRLVALIVPFIAVQRVFNGIVNGLSAYKKFAKIEIGAYLLGAGLTLVMLYTHQLEGAMIAIALIPLIQVGVLVFLFQKVLRRYIRVRELKWATPMAKQLLAFALMSVCSTVLLNYVEIDIRNMLAEDLGEDDAGVWTAMTFISKNYMVFSGALFTLYVIPKFTSIHTKKAFVRELGKIYTTLLPLFAVGMLVVYLLRYLIIDLIYTDFTTMAPLFKWQLLGDFVRLAGLVIMHQFLAKKLVRAFILTEVLSNVLFLIFAYTLTEWYGVEGVVIGHFIRYLIYFVVVLVLVLRYYKKQPSPSVENE